MDEPWLELYQPISAGSRAAWAACATAAGLTRWQAETAHGEAEVGARLQLGWPALGMAVELEVVAVVPERRLVLRAGASLTELEVEPHGVRVRQRGPDVERDRPGMEASWRLALAELAFALERHPGRERHVRWALRLIDLTPERAYALFTEPDGLRQWLVTEAHLGEERGAYALALRSGRTLSGSVLVRVPGRDVALTVDNHAGALLKLRTFPAPVGVGRWVACSWSRFGSPQPDDDAVVAELEAALDELATRGSHARRSRPVLH